MCKQCAMYRDIAMSAHRNGARNMAEQGPRYFTTSGTVSRQKQCNPAADAQLQRVRHFQVSANRWAAMDVLMWFGWPDTPASSKVTIWGVSIVVPVQQARGMYQESWSHSHG